MLPTQYPKKVAEEMMVFFVRPATLDGTAHDSQLLAFRESGLLNILNVQAKNSARTYGTVIRYMPHFVHLYCGSFGSNASASKPTNGGIQDAAMTYIRRFGTLRVHIATNKKMIKDTTIDRCC